MERVGERVKARIRFDYKGVRRPNRFLIGSRDPQEVAAEQRERDAVLLQKVPIQGIRIQDIDISLDSFKVYDPITGEETAYAPVQMTVDADSIEDLARFTMRSEFRTIDIIEPEQLCLTNKDMGRLLFRVNEEMRLSSNSFKRTEL